VKLTGKLKSLARRLSGGWIGAVITTLKYGGNRFTCPCCRGGFRKLLPYGADSRRDVMCPVCRSLERHRLIWLCLKNRTRLFTDEMSLLHFAPAETLRKRFRSMPNLSYVTADLAGGNAMLRMDITDIWFRDNIFDMILCSHVLEHVEDDRKAMSEMFRVLKPGGLLVVLVPIKVEQTFEDASVTSPRQRKRLFGQADHVRRYGPDIADRLQEAGFDVEALDYTAELDAESVRKYALAGMTIHFCTKPEKDRRLQPPGVTEETGGKEYL